MNRALSIPIALVASGALGVSLSACTGPSCGPGTVQQQQQNGTLRCVDVDDPRSSAPCEVDGGTAVIVGGLCVPLCDPLTTIEIDGVCVPKEPPQDCRPPSPGHACVMGSIFDFKTNQRSMVPIHVELYDPLTLLAGGNPIAIYDSSDGSSYVFQDFVAPPLGLIVVTTGKTTPNMTVAGTGALGIGNGNEYRVDAYALQTADANAWGFDLSMGAQVAKFYLDPKPAPNNLIANETMPVAGVTLTKNGAPAAGAAYFDAALTAIDPALTVTSSSGVALVASPIAAGTFPTFSGTGPTAAPIAWEQFLGGSAAGLVVITRFHPDM